MKNLSPEEILRNKEAASGFVYDDPKDEVTVTNTGNPVTLNENPVTLSENAYASQEPSPPKAPIEEQPVQNPPNSLGRVERKHPYFQQEAQSTQPHNSAQKQPGELGWKNIPMGILPSKGMYYPDGTRIAIRAAEVKEIRHFSTIDDEDRIDIEEKLGYILDKCMRMDFPTQGIVSYQDLKSEDRFFITLAIRDLTFTRGENSVILIPNNPCESKECPVREGFELRTGVLSMYEIEDKILEYYDSERRCFSFDIKKLDKNIKMFVPSIGVTKRISDFIISLAKRGVEIDDAFVQISPFIFEDWRTLTEGSFQARLKDSDSWSKEEFSLLFELSEKIKIGTKSKALVKCPKCGGREVTADITFPKGLRSLFVISDIIGELL
jgi:hypothetical protein